MTTVASRPARAAAESNRADDGVDALARGLAGEEELLRDLRTSLITQRGALAADDTAALEEVVNQIGRTLLTIREARRQRGLLAELIAGQPDAGLADVAEAIPPMAREQFRLRCRSLHDLAVAVSRELAINQAVIRRAIESGEHYLQELLTVPGTGEYPRDRGAGLPSGLILNQTA